MKKLTAFFIVTLFGFSLQAGKKKISAEHSSNATHAKDTISIANPRVFKNYRKTIKDAIRLRKIIETIKKSPRFAYPMGLQDRLSTLRDMVASAALAGFVFESGMPHSDKLLMAELLKSCLDDNFEPFQAAERSEAASKEFQKKFRFTPEELKEFNSLFDPSIQYDVVPGISEVLRSEAASREFEKKFRLTPEELKEFNSLMNK